MTDNPGAKHEPDLMGGPDPDEERTDVMGRPDPDEERTDVMRGPDYTTEEDQNPANGPRPR
jgi:hypothetical protein